MVRRCVKLCTGHEYAAKIINTKKLSARGRHGCAGGGWAPVGLERGGTGVASPPAWWGQPQGEEPICSDWGHSLTLVWELLEGWQWGHSEG